MNEGLLHTLKRYGLYNIHKEFCEVIIEKSKLDDSMTSDLLESLISGVYELGLKRGKKMK